MPSDPPTEAVSDARAVPLPQLGETIRAAPLFFGLQLAVQALGFAANLAMIWVLPREAYAILANALALLAFVQLAAEAGTGAAIASLGGPVAHLARPFGHIVGLAERVRRQLAFLCTLAAIPLLAWVLLQQGLASSSIVGLSALLLLGSTAQARSDALARAQQMAARPGVAQRAEIGANVVRMAAYLGLGGAILFASAPPPIIAWALGALAIQVTSAYLQGRWLVAGLDLAPPTQAEQAPVLREIWQLVRSQLPANLLFGLQGLTALGLLSSSATPDAAADFAGLARLGAVFTLFNAYLASALIPVIARAPAQRPVLRRLIFSLVAGAVGVSLVLILVGTLAKRWVIALLGPQYAHLEPQVGLFLTMLSVASVVSLFWSINVSRGWVRGSWWYPASILVGQLLFQWAWPVQSVADALRLTIVGFLCGLPAVLLPTLRELHHLREVPASAQS